jgi:hypothetical protein|nr:MAG TPA: hypothetical protein [Bacteriophage sp.]
MRFVNFDRKYIYEKIFFFSIFCCIIGVYDIG